MAADCEKAWIHTGWEDAMQKWCDWLEDMKKNGEEKYGSEKGGANDQECGRQCWGFAQNHEANTMEERSTDLGERREGCEII